MGARSPPHDQGLPSSANFFLSQRAIGTIYRMWLRKELRDALQTANWRCPQDEHFAASASGRTRQGGLRPYELRSCFYCPTSKRPPEGGLFYASLAGGSSEEPSNPRALSALSEKGRDHRIEGRLEVVFAKLQDRRARRGLDHREPIVPMATLEVQRRPWPHDHRQELRHVVQAIQPPLPHIACMTFPDVDGAELRPSMQKDDFGRWQGDAAELDRRHHPEHRQAGDRMKKPCVCRGLRRRW